MNDCTVCGNVTLNASCKCNECIKAGMSTDHASDDALALLVGVGG